MISAFDLIPYGYLITDADGDIQEANRAAACLFKVPDSFLPGKPLPIFVDTEYRQIFREKLALLKTSEQDLELEVYLIRCEGKPFPAALNGKARIDPKGCVSLHWLIRDITERKRAAEAGERVSLELRESLAKVKRLQGLLPICANCKKIRDDKGNWNQIETYIEEHSEAEFTHGICPECLEKLYPGFSNQ